MMSLCPDKDVACPDEGVIAKMPQPVKAAFVIRSERGDSGTRVLEFLELNSSVV
jgi:hypothetical protein